MVGLLMATGCGMETDRGGFGDLPPSDPPAPSPSEAAAPDRAAQIRVSAPGGLRFEPKLLELRAGGMTELELRNEDSQEHSLVVSELAVAMLAGPGQTVRSTVAIHRRNRGTFAFYCSIPGHREGGMEGTVEVG